MRGQGLELAPVEGRGVGDQFPVRAAVIACKQRAGLAVGEVAAGRDQLWTGAAVHPHRSVAHGPLSAVGDQALLGPLGRETDDERE